MQKMEDLAHLKISGEVVDIILYSMQKISSTHHHISLSEGTKQICIPFDAIKTHTLVIKFTVL